ncbi:MAG: hypothetical protein NC394_06800 [Bacteroides sp.]|nr:hypothetical protein [Bacteroides sp.]
MVKASETPSKPDSNGHAPAADRAAPRLDRRLPRAAIESAYGHLCTVYGYSGEVSEVGITEEREVKLAENVPCRLSFELSYPLEQTENTAESSQRVKLFLPPELSVPCGSRIAVTVNGEELSFGYSGEQALYPTHKEIRLKPLEKHK